MYEYFITLSEEIGLFWRYGLSGAAVWFYLSRYLFLAIRLFELVGSFVPLSDKVWFRSTFSTPNITFHRLRRR